MDLKVVSPGQDQNKYASLIMHAAHLMTNVLRPPTERSLRAWVYVNLQLHEGLFLGNVVHQRSTTKLTERIFDVDRRYKTLPFYRRVYRPIRFTVMIFLYSVVRARKWSKALKHQKCQKYKKLSYKIILSSFFTIFNSI